MTILGMGLYEARDGFFHSGNQFRGKYEALAIYLTATFGVALMTPILNQAWADVLPQLLPGELLGLILVLGMVAVNRAAEWNLFDKKSLVIYGMGIVLIFNPELVQAV